MVKPRVLFVEDEESISGPFSSALTREGFDPAVCGTLGEARAAWARDSFDLVLLDLMLPDGDGRDLARELRASGSEVPIIILTARGTELERVVGLELGADDYVVKPFSGAEVIARMRAVLRRVKPSAPAVTDLEVGPLRVELGARRVFLEGDELALEPQGVRPARGADVARRRGRHARGPDLAGVGRELVRLDQDARRPRRMAAREAGRRRGLAALGAHRARRRVPLHRAGGMGVLSLRARLVLALAYVLVLAIGSMLVPLVRSVRDRVNAEVETQALSQAEVVAATYAGGAAADELVKSAAREVRGRVVIVDRAGRVVADSAPGSIGADFSSRPEIARALSGRIWREQRDSATLGQRILATSVPVVRDGRTDGAVRITQSVGAVGRALRSATLGLVLVGLIVLALGLAAGALLAASVVRPLRRLASAARRAGEGDLSVRVPVEGSSEQREVGAAFNEMTGRVQRMVDAQRDFVADASHQLRTPLTGLRLRLEEAAATADGPALEQIEGGLSEVDRLSGVVTELLILSEAGAARPPDAATDLLAGRAAGGRALGVRRRRRRGRVERRALHGRRPRPDPRRADRERDRLRAAGPAHHAGRRAGPAGGGRPGPGPGAGRGGDDLRPLPPRHRRPRLAASRHRPRAPDRPRARRRAGTAP